MQTLIVTNIAIIKFDVHRSMYAHKSAPLHVYPSQKKIVYLKHSIKKRGTITLHSNDVDTC